MCSRKLWWMEERAELRKRRVEGDHVRVPREAGTEKAEDQEVLGNSSFYSKRNPLDGSQQRIHQAAFCLHSITGCFGKN